MPLTGQRGNSIWWNHQVSSSLNPTKIKTRPELAPPTKRRRARYAHDPGRRHLTSYCLHSFVFFLVWQLINTEFWLLQIVGSASHHTAAFIHSLVVCREAPWRNPKSWRVRKCFPLWCGWDFIVVLPLGAFLNQSRTHSIRDTCFLFRFIKTSHARCWSMLAGPKGILRPIKNHFFLCLSNTPKEHTVAAHRLHCFCPLTCNSGNDWLHKQRKCPNIFHLRWRWHQCLCQ